MANRLICYYQTIARTLTWIGALVIVVLSVVPATDRPVTGGGQVFEHFTAFALVAGMSVIGYSLSLTQRFLLAVFFCGAIELLQVPLPTRHARVSDFAIDLVGSGFAIAVVVSGRKLIGRRHKC
jgi:hypothetical protein